MVTVIEVHLLACTNAELVSGKWLTWDTKYDCIDEEVFTYKYVLVNESFVNQRAIFQVLKFLPRYSAVHCSDNVIEKLHALYSLYYISHIFVCTTILWNSPCHIYHMCEIF